MRCKARRRGDVRTSQGAATQQRARFTPALRVTAGNGVRSVVGLAKGMTIGCPPPPCVHPFPASNAICRMIESRPYFGRLLPATISKP